MCDITEILNTPNSLLHDATPFAFITTIRNHDLFTQVAHPLEGVDADAVSLEDYEVKDIMLGRPTRDTARQMMTMGVKEVLKHMEQDDFEIRPLRRQVEILKGYLAEVVGHLDLEDPEETLNTILKEGEGTRLNPF